MADEKQLALLRSGVHNWNEWRYKGASKQNDFPANPDLSGADLAGADLSLAILVRADLTGANLTRANLTYARLNDADLARATLNEADLTAAFLFRANIVTTRLVGANLTGATLSKADLTGADLTRAQLVGARLIQSNLGQTILVSADLTGADLSAAILERADLTGANMSNARLLWTVLASAKLEAARFHGADLYHATISDADLSLVLGLDDVVHSGPSSLSVDTLYRSAGKIPEKFLRGCGIPDDFIAYLPSLVGVEQAIRFNSCFISYSTKDDDFAHRLHARLRAEHVRVWFAPEDMKGGEKLSDQIERAVEVHDRLLLVLSEHSIGSAWVMREIRKAIQQEVAEKRRKLFPIRLCDFETLTEWKAVDSVTGTDLAEEVRQYFIPDFSRWKEHDQFEDAFKKLLRDLRAEEDRQATRLQTA